MVGLTRTVARELGRFGVRCNAIRPLALGMSTKEYNEATSRSGPRSCRSPWPHAARKLAFAAATPDSHPPAKISPIVVWLCTDAARGVNGRTFHVAGNTITRLSRT